MRGRRCGVGSHDKNVIYRDDIVYPGAKKLIIFHKFMTLTRGFRHPNTRMSVRSFLRIAAESFLLARLLARREKKRKRCHCVSVLCCAAFPQPSSLLALDVCEEAKQKRSFIFLFSSSHACSSSSEFFLSLRLAPSYRSFTKRRECVSDGSPPHTPHTQAQISRSLEHFRITQFPRQMKFN
jgi:hypothetical protein